MYVDAERYDTMLRAHYISFRIHVYDYVRQI